MDKGDFGTEAADLESGFRVEDAKEEMDSPECTNSTSSVASPSSRSASSVPEENISGRGSYKQSSVVAGRFTERGVYDLSVIKLSYKVKARERHEMQQRLMTEHDMEADGSNGKQHHVDKPQSCFTAWMTNTRPAKMVEKVLLNGVSAEAKHGEILAVVGPSGAGKSTFLDAVAGRIRASSLQGQILLNGRPVDSTFRRISGYVMQDDQLFPMLTVRETLLFSARLRIPNSMSKAAKVLHVENMMKDLGLTSCANTVIGDDQNRGVSGGEKRRVSIGVDLIHDPAVLFLDEPTSGLDSVAAFSVVQMLRNLAENHQRTIILTIHQPSFRILELIHNFLVLSQGTAVYNGPYANLAEHFRSFTRLSHGPRDSGEQRQDANALEYALDVVEVSQESAEQIKALLDFSGDQGRSQECGVNGNAGQVDCSKAGSMKGLDSDMEYATGFWSELWVLLDRSFKNILRTKELFLTRFFTFFFASFIVGSLFYKAGFTPEGAKDRESFFAFSLMAIIFSSIDSLPTFLDERQIYIRETSRGAYRTASYVLAGTLAGLPFLGIIALVGATASYFMVGLASTAQAFLTFYAAAFLAMAVGNSFVVFVAGFVPNFAVGVTVSSAAVAFFFLCSGFFIASSRIPVYWMWINYLSTFKYPLQMMMLNEFGTLSDVCWDAVTPQAASTNGTAPGVQLPLGVQLAPGVDLPPGFNASQFIIFSPPSAPEGCLLTSEEILTSFDLQGQTIWANALVMVAFFAAYRFLFFLLLKGHTMRMRK